MPIRSAIDNKEFLDSYSQYVDAVENWKRWGTKVQELGAVLAAHANYTAVLTEDEKVSLQANISASAGVSPPPADPVRIIF
jgi:hypothetical protein